MRYAFALVVACWLGGAAWAHGGLPVSSGVLRKGDDPKVYVPVVFWGIWVGGDGTPWRWICEEEINAYRNRHLALSRDGTWYATDSTGLTIATDNGCTWKGFANGEPADKRVSDVAADPVDGATAWATTAQSGASDADGGTLPPDNALYVTHDHGTSFQRVAGLADQSTRLFQSVRPGPTGQTLYVTSTDVANGPPAIHRSDDGGATFHTYLIDYQLGGLEPYSADVQAIDPRNPQVVYVRVFVTGLDADGGPVSRHVLLRSTDGGATTSELTSLDGVVSASGISRGIDGVAIDTGRGRVLVATSKGLLAGDDATGGAPLTLAPFGNLSQAQCIDVDPNDGSLLACSTNYAPDFKALARAEDGATFESILAYVDTAGTVDCPASTPVGAMCPLYWQMYGSQLGITFTDGGVVAPSDGGAQPPDDAGCGCQLGARPTSPSALALVAALALLALALRADGARDARRHVATRGKAARDARPGTASLSQARGLPRP